MISTSFTLEELKKLENAGWIESAYKFEFPDLDIQISLTSDFGKRWYYRLGDHMFKWEQPCIEIGEIQKYLQKIADHRRLILSD